MADSVEKNMNSGERVFMAKGAKRRFDGASRREPISRAASRWIRTADRRKFLAAAIAAFYGFWAAPAAAAYAFNTIVPDVRQAAAVSGGSACPVRAHQITSAAS